MKLRRVFREMRRVVKPNGSMTVMFTHRETEMWNALGLALLETGWEIGSSWPVHTESEHSLHIARKNAARSTIFLFCRPRELKRDVSFWTRDLQDEVRGTAAERARDFHQVGHRGGRPVPLDVWARAGRAVAQLADHQRGGGPGDGESRCA